MNIHTYIITDTGPQKSLESFMNATFMIQKLVYGVQSVQSE